MDTGGGSTTRAREAASPSLARLVERVRHRRPGDAHRVVGGLLLVAWLAWLVVTVLTQPRLVSDARFREDVASGDVVAWRVVAMSHADSSSWVEDLDLWWLSLGPDGRPTDADHSGSVTIAYATSSAPFTRVLDNRVDPLPSDYTALLQAAGAPVATTWTEAPSTEPPTWVDWSALAVGVPFFGLLLLGPRPLHGTRWFWFWFAFPTLGLGVVLYAVVEHLRRPRTLSDEVRGRAFDVVDTAPWPDPAATEASTADPGPSAPQDGVGTNRRSGLMGWLLSIGLALVTQSVMGVLLTTTGWVWLVRP